MATSRYPGFLPSLLKAQCPKCRHHGMFSHKPYDLRRFLRMPERCPHCGFRFEVEPGFWWGAMYITYAFNVAVLIVGLVFFLLYDLPVWAVVLTVFSLALVLLPIFVRYSRVVMLYLFAQVRFDQQRHDNTPAQNAAFFEETHNPG
jgi:uncharacterized protein (DUF983 family)